MNATTRVNYDNAASHMHRKGHSKGIQQKLTCTRNRIIARASSHDGRGQKKSVVIVGGGWAGFGAAKHLVDQDFDVTLVDASSQPGGLSAGWRDEENKPMEAGMKGFWYQYHNIFSLVGELGIRPNPFTDWTESSFYRPSGLLTEGPIFQRQPRLPTMLGQAVYTFPLFRDLSLVDLSSMLSLLPAMLEFNSDPETYQMYDEMTARELFRQSGVTKELYQKFLKPLLLVGLFAPAEELSAASVLETLYFYAAAHQHDFDVCWCRGSVTETIFKPLVEYITERGGRIIGGQAVTDLRVQDNRVSSVIAKNLNTKLNCEYNADAVVFAVGIKAMQTIIGNSSNLSTLPEMRSIMNLTSIDCVATRLWLDKLVKCRTPSNVFAGFDEDIGGTFFHLNDLHDEYAVPGQGSVITADFYHANELIPLSDKEIVDKVKSYLDICNPDFKEAKIQDYGVLKIQKAVTHFSPGSYRYRPKQKTSMPNLFMAGDWVKDVDHGANGLSQERAYVTGLMAANYVIECLNQGTKAKILQVEEDEAHIAFGKAIAKQRRALLPDLPNFSFMRQW